MTTAQKRGWRVEFYVEADGSSPVEGFIAGLPKQERAAIARVIGMLEQLGTDLRYPYVEHIEGKIWELRPKPNRLLYFAYTGRRFVILHAFRKKSRKTPRRELETARRRMAEYLESEK